MDIGDCAPTVPSHSGTSVPISNRSSPNRDSPSTATLPTRLTDYHDESGLISLVTWAGLNWSQNEPWSGPACGLSGWRNRPGPLRSLTRQDFCCRVSDESHVGETVNVIC